MVRTVFRVFALMLIAMTFFVAATPQLPWGVPAITPTITTENIDGLQGTCPEPTEELKACIRQWGCEELLRLDLRCLLNLNGIPLVGNVLGGLLGGLGGQSPRPGGAQGGLLGGLLGGSGGLLGGSGGLLGGSGGLLGSLLG
ncbi:PREDICTED: DNA topoisomerase 3-alpha-like isoform X1 [Rhagoletis zephyria]|uniref:DNA topoisomerase 3-alpha-like isoform X1 n=1 Tax=Rhagoletis zephyria TaxID=28612 RepID=UPI0008115410|nr:PREDICTED: DNA topoisomerase 3-alpha-like isoform X1 [Rhagoletis zephyria]